LTVLLLAAACSSDDKGTPASSGTYEEYGGSAAETPVRVCTFAGGREIPSWVAGAVWSFFKKL
jgi:hypothetical protein